MPEYELPSLSEMTTLGGPRMTRTQQLALDVGEKPVLEKGQILLSKKQREAWRVLSDPTKRYSCLYGGTRCVAGDTVLDGQTKTIAELAEEGKPVRVLTTHGYEMAEAPFRKGFANLWTVLTSSGKTVTVTSDHRFWNGRRWIKTHALRKGDPIAVLGPSSERTLQESNSERDRKGSPLNAPHLSDIGRDYQDCYSFYRHQCDGQLHQVEASCQAYRAFEFGAPAHTHRTCSRHGSGIRRGLLDQHGQECIQTYPLSSRQTRRDDPQGFDTLFEVVGRAFLHVYEWSLGQLRIFAQADRQSSPVKQALEALGNLRSRSFGAQPSRTGSHESPRASMRGGVRPSSSQPSPQSQEWESLYQSQLGSPQVDLKSSKRTSSDTPCKNGYTLDAVLSITPSAYAPFYTLHVPGSQQYYANGILHHNSGKTFTVIRAIVARAIKAPNTRHALLRFRGNAARASIALDTLPSVMRVCYPGIKLEESRQEGYFTLPNGSQLWIGGLDDKDRVEKILGTEFITIFLNEASQIPYASYMVAMTRLAQVHPNLQQRAYVDLNPVGKTHWTNCLFGLHIDPVTKLPLRNPEAYASANLNPVDNAHNLSKDFLDNLAFMPEKQRKRFFEGVYVDEVEGALWSYESLDRNRADPEDIPVGERQRVVVAVDPSGAKSVEDTKSDEIGISVVAKGRNGHAYVLADPSLRASPREWALAAVGAYHQYSADAIIAEGNFGGALVEATIKAVDPNVNVKMVSASRGKVIRAEPIAAHHEAGRIHHVGKFPKLEDQLCAFSSDGYKGADSPDHADAMIWACTELLGTPDGTGIIEFYRRLTEQSQEQALGAH